MASINDHSSVHGVSALFQLNYRAVGGSHGCNRESLLHRRSLANQSGSRTIGPIKFCAPPTVVTGVAIH